MTLELVVMLHAARRSARFRAVRSRTGVTLPCHAALRRDVTWRGRTPCFDTRLCSTVCLWVGATRLLLSAGVEWPASSASAPGTARPPDPEGRRRLVLRGGHRAAPPPRRPARPRAASRWPGERGLGRTPAMRAPAGCVAGRARSGRVRDSALDSKRSA